MFEQEDQVESDPAPLRGDRVSRCHAEVAPGAASERGMEAGIASPQSRSHGVAAASRVGTRAANNGRVTHRKTEEASIAPRTSGGDGFGEKQGKDIGALKRGAADLGIAPPPQ